MLFKNLFPSGDSTCGQRAVYQLGMNGIPIYNVNNNCSTGASALFLAKQLVENGQNDCVMALGFEKMERGSLTNKYNDRTLPMDKHVNTMAELDGFGTAAISVQLFGNAGEEHMRKYGSKPEHFAKIAYKNHKHSVNNPYSQFQDGWSVEQVLKAPKITNELTKFMCSPTSVSSASRSDVRTYVLIMFRTARPAASSRRSTLCTPMVLKTRQSRSSRKRWPPTVPRRLRARVPWRS